MFFLVDVLHIQYISRDEPRAEHTLQNYGGLSPFYTAVQGVGRVGLLSQNKPHERTHRLKKKIINVTEDDVCVNNGLLLRYFDFSMRTFVGGFKMSDEIANLCMYKLPKRSTDLQNIPCQTLYHLPIGLIAILMASTRQNTLHQICLKMSISWSGCMSLPFLISARFGEEMTRVICLLVAGE